MIIKNIHKIKEGTIPFVQISQRETIPKVHIPCPFIVCNIFVYYTRYTSKSKRINYKFLGLVKK